MKQDRPWFAQAPTPRMIDEKKIQLGVGRPDRQTVIQKDEIINIRIALETMTQEQFVEAM